LPGKLNFNYSHTFDGVIWNIITAGDEKVLFLEVRNQERRQVSFSSLLYTENKFLWREKKLEEQWWISLSVASRGVVVYTMYLETANPDRKAVIAYRTKDHSLLWWENDFSLQEVRGPQLHGFSTKLSKPLALDLLTGKPIEPQSAAKTTNQADIHPIQYTDDSGHFATVKTFLQGKLNFEPVMSLEYLEHDGLIFISYYRMENGLANYLLVVTEEGDVVLHEKLAEQLKGIGLDTFFILDGCVFFVKNRKELVSYSIV